MCDMHDNEDNKQVRSLPFVLVDHHMALILSVLDTGLENNRCVEGRDQGVVRSG